jgi:hypothetical protein
MTTLVAGDLCITVPTPYDCPIDEKLGWHGRTVVLLRPYVGSMSARQKTLAPFWCCSGLPPTVRAVPELALRKIPPAPMAEDEKHEEEIEA